MKTSRNEQEQAITSSPKERMKFCKFYKGEAKSPYEYMGDTDDITDSNYYHTCNMFWFYEKCWCEMREQEHTQHVREYAACGMADFQKDDGTPISLKALLFNRYCHWCSSRNGFKRWYIDEYCISPFVQDIADGKQSDEAILQYMRVCPELWFKVYDKMKLEKGRNADREKRLCEALLLMNEAQ